MSGGTRASDAHEEPVSAPLHPLEAMAAAPVPLEAIKRYLDLGPVEGGFSMDQCYCIMVAIKAFDVATMPGAFFELLWSTGDYLHARGEIAQPNLLVQRGMDGHKYRAPNYRAPWKQPITIVTK
jgi:hypothetical protein